MIKHPLVSAQSTIQCDEECIQPNGIDLRVDRIFQIDSDCFISYRDKRVHRERTEILPDSDGMFLLEQGRSYEIMAIGKCSIANNEAGIVKLRSTFSRNGIFSSGGLYDSGYQGSIGVCVFSPSGNMILEYGSRFGQFVIFYSEMTKPYGGGYGLDAKGKAKSEEEKVY